MRVLFLTGEFPPMQGGVGDCTHELAQALAKRGVEVGVLTAEDGGKSNVERQTSNVERQTSNVRVYRLVRKWDWSALRPIRRMLAVTRADIVHIQYQTAAFGMHPMINFAPRLFRPSLLGQGGRGVRFVVTFHDLRVPYLFPKAGRLREGVTFQLARSCDAVIATNAEDYDRLVTLNLKRLTCIPIGSNIAPIPPPDFDRDAVRAQLGVAPGETLLCYFGFLNESKGGETLIQALTEIPNAKLLMLGGQLGASDPTNARYLARVKKLTDELGLTARVLWTDFLPQPQVSAHLFASDLCVLPYRDGASYRRGTLMAALAHGMAIVTTASPRGQTTSARRPMGSHPSAEGSGRLPELRDGENVLLVPPDDPRAIAEAVKRLAASPALCARLRAGARATAEFFTWDKIADQHLELYERLL